MLTVRPSSFALAAPEIMLTSSPTASEKSALSIGIAAPAKVSTTFSAVDAGKLNTTMPTTSPLRPMIPDTSLAKLGTSGHADGRPGLTVVVDFELTDEVFGGQEVVIVAERPLVQKDLTATTAIVSGDEIRSLPVENFGQVIGLQAGVVNGHFRGGRMGEVGYWVDGMPVTDVFDGSLGVSVENNMVDELQVVTGAFNAEYGQAMSGIVNIVTRDGDNRFSGGIKFQFHGF